MQERTGRCPKQCGRRHMPDLCPKCVAEVSPWVLAQRHATIRTDDCSYPHVRRTPGSIRPKCGQCWPNVGQILADKARSRSKLARNRPNAANVGQVWPNFGQVANTRPKFDQVCQRRPKGGQFGPRLGRVGPSSARGKGTGPASGTICADFFAIPHGAAMRDIVWAYYAARPASYMMLLNQRQDNYRSASRSGHFVCRNLARVGRFWAKCCPKLDEFGPNLVDAGPKLIGSRPCLIEACQSQTNFARVGRNSGQHWSSSVHVCPNSVNMGPKLTDSGAKLGTNVGRVRDD